MAWAASILLAVALGYGLRPKGAAPARAPAVEVAQRMAEIPASGTPTADVVAAPPVIDAAPSPAPKAATP